jgi:hypothetical protein
MSHERVTRSAPSRYAGRMRRDEVQRRRSRGHEERSIARGEAEGGRARAIT